jgi:hypothetical protein
MNPFGLDSFWIGYPSTEFSMETLGSPVFPYNPYLLLISSQAPVEPYWLVFNASLVLPQSSEKLRLQRLTNFSRLHLLPLAIAVYASCWYLYQLRKTRFRWLTKPYRTGLTTCRVVTKRFIFQIPASRALHSAITYVQLLYTHLIP